MPSFAALQKPTDGPAINRSTMAMSLTNAAAARPKAINVTSSTVSAANVDTTMRATIPTSLPTPGNLNPNTEYPMSKIAHIIAIRAASIAGWAGLGFGIRPVDEVGETAIFDNGEIWVGTRQVLETSPDFIQPIPTIGRESCRERVCQYE